MLLKYYKKVEFERLNEP